MKTTEQFKNIIKSHLDERASNDELFAVKYSNESKNIDDCVTYILSTVKKSGVNGYASEEIFGMAIHYYDEESIDIGKEIQAKIVLNKRIEISEEDKELARKEAIQQYHDEVLNDMRNKPRPKREPKVKEVVQQSLFDL